MASPRRLVTSKDVPIAEENKVERICFPTMLDKSREVRSGSEADVALMLASVGIGLTIGR